MLQCSVGAGDAGLQLDSSLAWGGPSPSFFLTSFPGERFLNMSHGQETAPPPRLFLGRPNLGQTSPGVSNNCALFIEICV